MTKLEEAVEKIRRINEWAARAKIEKAEAVAVIRAAANFEDGCKTASLFTDTHKVKVSVTRSVSVEAKRIPAIRKAIGEEKFSEIFAASFKPRATEVDAFLKYGPRDAVAVFQSALKSTENVSVTLEPLEVDDAQAH